MVNAVGGVVIDVDWPVKDDEYPTADYGYMRIYFGPGPQLMDGAQALQYARSRHGMNDFARAGRQQKVILDRDLAKLYGVPTRTLVQAVKRNADRFPDDPDAPLAAFLDFGFVHAVLRPARSYP